MGREGKGQGGEGREGRGEGEKGRSEGEGRPPNVRDALTPLIISHQRSCLHHRYVMQDGNG